MITTEELTDWLRQDTTIYFLQSLYNQREIFKEELVEMRDDVVAANFLRGKITAIQSIITANAKEIMQNFTDTLEEHYAEEQIIINEQEKFLLKP